MNGSAATLLDPIGYLAGSLVRPRLQRQQLQKALAVANGKYRVALQESPQGTCHLPQLALFGFAVAAVILGPDPRCKCKPQQ